MAVPEHSKDIAYWLGAKKPRVLLIIAALTLAIAAAVVVPRSPVRGLIRQLGGDEAAHNDAVAQLVRIGSPAVPLLIKTLETQGGPEWPDFPWPEWDQTDLAHPRLLRALTARDWRIRVGCAQALVKIGDPRSVRALLRVNRWWDYVSQVDADGLGASGEGQEGNWLRQQAFSLRSEVVEGVAGMGEAAAPAVVESLRQRTPVLTASDDIAAYQMVYSYPGRIEDEVLVAMVTRGETKTVLDHLKDPNPVLRLEMIGVLAYGGNKATIASLAQMLADPLTCYPGATAIARIDTDEGDVALAPFIEANGIRQSLIDYRGIIRRGDDSSVPLLEFLLEKYGTLDMAADYKWATADYRWAGKDVARRSPSGALPGIARAWARRKGLGAQLDEVPDCTDRPRWGSASEQ